MEYYRYKAKDEKGKTYSGVMAAINEVDLHARLKEEGKYLVSIKEESAKPVIRMVKLSEHTDYDALNEMEADYLLFDSGRGCGKVFDWNLLKQVQEKCRKPFFLAGGIGPENAKEAVMQVKPYAIDLSSGLETNGVKDLAKMRALMEQLNANSESYAK